MIEPCECVKMYKVSETDADNFIKAIDKRNPKDENRLMDLVDLARRLTCTLD